MSLFDWDANNEAHIARHEVDPYEAEEAMNDPNKVSFSTHGKGIKGIIGQTDDGRFLVVIFIIRNGLNRVVTAREATEREKHSRRRRNH